LIYLIKKEHIIKICDGKIERFFISNKVSNKEKELLKILRQKIPRNIILLFFSRICLSQIEISKELELPTNTLDFHLKKLKNLGIIKPLKYTKEGVLFNWHKPNQLMIRKPISNEIIYQMTDILFIHTTLKKYFKSICSDEITCPLIVYIKEFEYSKIPDKTITFQKQLNRAADKITSMIPIPFCA
jgi:hypothetical protein